jgi:hypothetical protein
VVIAPDVVGNSFFVPECKAVLDLWRDGGITPIVTRDLLVRYVKVLRGLRIPDSLIRTWILWLTAEGKSLHLPDVVTGGKTTQQALLEAARSGGATSIVSNREDSSEGGAEFVWTTADEFVRSQCG